MNYVKRVLNTHVYHFTGNVRQMMCLAIYRLSKVWLKQNNIAYNTYGKNMKDTRLHD